MRWALAGLLLTIGMGPARAAPDRSSDFMPIGVAPARLAAASRLPVMVMPEGWQPGDVAAVLAPSSDWSPGARERLTAVLMEAGAAVLQLPDAARPTASPPDAALAEALRALHGVVGVGLA
ncbi:hypothetical protein, partial [Falsiroseomonas oryziterrae]|uniref:hypothetical protein n=1 Tax=Falsiroseomonas oryziterrae TaxID=2911368 RepID=UPI001F480A86